MRMIGEGVEYSEMVLRSTKERREGREVMKVRGGKWWHTLECYP